MIDFPNEESKWTWLGAFLDTDGSISLIKVRTSYRQGFAWRTTMQFNQTSKDLLEQIKEIIDSKVNLYEIKRSRHKTQYHLCVTSNTIRKILPKILPYLIKKREQAILLNEALILLNEHRPPHISVNNERLLKIYHKLQSLHEKGTKRR